MADSYTRHFDPDFALAADLILRTINKYGNSIANQNYQAETESLRQLCDDLEAAGPVKDALAKLGLKAWGTEMRAANTAFATVYQQRNKESSQSPTVNVKELRAACKIAYDGMMNMMDATNLVPPSANLTALTKVTRPKKSLQVN